jgi:hypothetical protein
VSDYLRSMADFWSAQGKAMLESQEKAARSVTEGVQSMLAGKMPPLPQGATDLGAVTAELAQASEAFTRLWSAAGSMSGELAGKLAKHASGGDDGLATAVFERIADPRQWLGATGELDDVLNRMAEGPRLADLWDLERRYARVMKAWTTLRRRGFEHQRITLDAWLSAGRRFIEELAGHSSAEGKPLEPKRALSLWTEVANRELLATQRSEPFLNSQRELIRASSELRLAQQELVEHFGKQYGFPTRTELDDVHRTLTEMRRELRRLKRALADAQAPATPPAPPPAALARPTKRKATP